MDEKESTSKPGFRKAKKAGAPEDSFAKKRSSSPGKLGKTSRLAETLSSLRRKGAAK